MNVQDVLAFFRACAEGKLDDIHMMLTQNPRMVKKLVEATDEDGMTPLMIASTHGRINVVNYLFKQGTSINRKRNDGFDALLLAVKESHTNVVKYLLQHNANVNSKSVNNISSLMLATMNNDVEIVRVLLKAGANIHGRAARTGQTALHMAAMHGYVNIMMILIKEDTPMMQRDDENLIALHYAAASGQLEAVKLLVKTIEATKDSTAKDAMLEAVDSEGLTPLMLATIRGHVTTVEYLIYRGASITYKQADGFDTLLLAVKNGHTAIVKLLLKHNNVNIESASNQSCTALMIATMRNSLDVVRLLLDAGANPNAHDDKGITALHIATAYKYVSILRLLVEKGADVFQQNAHGASVLHIARSADVVEALREAVKTRNSIEEAKVMLETRGPDGRTPLMTAVDVLKENNKGVTALRDAVETGSLEMVMALLDGKWTNSDRIAMLETTDANGRTPLMFAAYVGHKAMAKFLIEHGASVEPKEDSGFDALLLAAKEGHTAIVKLLLEHYAYVDSENAKKWTALMISSKKNDLDTVHELLQAGANPNARAYDGVTPLSIASKFGHTELAKLLIQAGADVSQQNDWGVTALHVAASSGHSEVVTILIQAMVALSSTETAKVEPEGVQLDGITPLMVAASCGHTDVVKRLVEQGTNVMEKDVKGWTALHSAAESGHAEVIKLFAEIANARKAKEMLTVRGHNGWTPLMVAASRGRVEVIKLLVEAGVDVMQRSNEGGTAVHIAAQFGDMEVVKLLVEAVSSTNIKEILEAENQDGITPLMVAAFHGHVEVVEYLTEQHVDVGHEALGGHDALYCAAQEGHKSIVEHLINMGARVDHKSIRGDTALMIACERGHEDVVRVLNENGACLESRSRGNRTALFAACTKGASAIALSLIGGHREIVNLQDENGITPLIQACGRCDSKVVETLLKHGAHPNVQPDVLFVGPAMNAAAQEGRHENVEVLIKYGANINVQGYDGFTPLISAADAGHENVCELLIKNGADLTIQTAEGYTALHRAVQFRHQKCIQLLVEAGIDINIEDNEGLTAVVWAVFLGYFDLVKYFQNRLGTIPLRSVKTSPKWPLYALYEVYNQPLEGLERMDPPWFISNSAITREHRLMSTRPAIMTTPGTWLQCTVDIIDVIPGDNVKTLRIPHLFVFEIDRWTPLLHPNVLRLHGGCHRDRLFFVVEHTMNDRLPSYISKHSDRTWRTLHQVALGLRYLHERSIVLHRLCGDHIRIGDDGLPKVAGFGGLLQLSNDELWRAPEIRDDPTRANMESDVYAFAMVIIEVVSGAQPYADIDVAKVKEHKKNHQRPSRHPKFDDRAWKLIKRMTCERERRLRMSEVVSELAWLAEQETKVSTDDQYPTGICLSHDSIIAKMKQADLLCDSMSVSEGSVRLRDRLIVVLDQPVEEFVSTNKPSISAYSLILDDYVRALERLKDIQKFNRVAYIREYISTLFSLHNELDRVVEELRIPDPSAGATWRGAWRSWRCDQLKVLEQQLCDIIDGKSNDNIESLTCLVFELRKNHLHYSGIQSKIVRDACNQILSVLPEKLPEWFLPSYEVDIQEYVAKGSYGSVHRGRWLDSDVVFKTLLNTTENDKFIREVRIWFSLDHPHVIKLFGACHVGKQVFVSEWAEHGNLDFYVENYRDEMWQKLYEAALGLYYLHERNVIHCDLKCNNILVGRDRKAKLADFGLSRLEALSNHASRQLPRYAAPEVLRGAPPSKASDIYSFGMCIIEIVSGTIPYSNKVNAIVSRRVLRGKFHDRPNEFVCDRHWELVLQCCQFEPCERASLVEILASLKRFADESCDTECKKDASDPIADIGG